MAYDDYGLSGLLGRPQVPSFANWLTQAGDLYGSRIRNRLLDLQLQDAIKEGRTAARQGDGLKRAYPDRLTAPTSRRGQGGAGSARSAMSVNSLVTPPFPDAGSGGGQGTSPTPAGPSAPRSHLPAVLQAKLEQLKAVHEIDPLIAVRVWNADPRLSGFGKVQAMPDGELKMFRDGESKTIAYSVRAPDGKYRLVRPDDRHAASLRQDYAAARTVPERPVNVAVPLSDGGEADKIERDERRRPPSMRRASTISDTTGPGKAGSNQMLLLGAGLPSEEALRKLGRWAAGKIGGKVRDKVMDITSRMGPDRIAKEIVDKEISHLDPAADWEAIDNLRKLKESIEKEGFPDKADTMGTLIDEIMSGIKKRRHGR